MPSSMPTSSADGGHREVGGDPARPRAPARQEVATGRRASRYDAVADERHDDRHVEAVGEDREDPAVAEEQGLDDERDADADDRRPRPEDDRDQRRRRRRARWSRPGTGMLNIMIVKLIALKIASSGIVRLLRTSWTLRVATAHVGTVDDAHADRDRPGSGSRRGCAPGVLPGVPRRRTPRSALERPTRNTVYWIIDAIASFCNRLPDRVGTGSRRHRIPPESVVARLAGEYFRRP